MSAKPSTNGQMSKELGEAIRDACVQAALDAYESAKMDGLCHEGAWEVAVGAIQRLNVARIIEREGKQLRP